MNLEKLLKKGYEFINSTINTNQSNKDSCLITSETSDNIDVKEVYHDNDMHIIKEENDMTKDLMMLVGDAIEQWSKKYNMENLPKKIVFKQALTILNGIDQIWFYD